MQRMMITAIMAYAIGVVLGKLLLPVLYKLKFGQNIYELAPEAHKKKQGTPIMGGLIFAGACILATLAMHTYGVSLMRNMALAMILMALGNMGIGFADDMTKIRGGKNAGLTPKQKIVGQMVVCLAFSAYCYFHPQVGSKVIVPFVNVEWDLGIFYIPLLSLTILFMINSANLQDGLDGILSSVTAVGNVAWAALAVMFASAVAANAAFAANYQAVAIFAMALCGACIGFLRFNHYPATVFMGDTGSEFIGGAVVGIAMLLRQPFLLLLITFTMVASSVTVIIQRYYFKATRKIFGEPRRLFKMTPIHHHFELCGMKETKIVLMYAVVTAVLSLIALLSAVGLQLM